MKPKRYRFGPFELDVDTGELRKQGRRLRLPGRSFRALTALLERPGELVSREELKERVWPGEVHVEFERGLNNAVYLARQALGETGGVIETVPGRGYRFLGDVEALAVGVKRFRLFPSLALALTLVTLTVWAYSTLDRNEADPRAQEAVLRGNYFFAQKTPASLKKSLESFEEAARLSPDLAAAHAGMAKAYHFLAAVGVVERDEALRQTTVAATRALELDPACGDALAILAESRFRFAKRRDGVESLFRRALEIEPSSADIHQWYGNFLAIEGRLDEGIAEMKRARALDPLSLHVNSDYAALLYDAGRREQAMHQFAETLELDPDYSKTHYLLGQIHLMEGRREEALAAFEKTLALAPDVPKYRAAYDAALSRSR